MRLRIWPARRGATPNIHLRSRIIFLLVSLMALWVFSAWITTQEGYNLLQTGKRDTTAGRPTKTLISYLQEERRSTMVYLGGKYRGTSRADLQTRRARTDTMVTQWRQSASQAPGDKTKRFVKATSEKLGTLATVRTGIDSGTTNRDVAAQAYNQTIDAALLINSANAELDDPGISADGRALIALTRAREMLAREDAELAGVLAAGRFQQGEFTRFTQAVALRTFTEQDALPQLPDADRAGLQAIQKGTAYTTLQRLENKILAQPRQQGRLGVTAAQWQAATRPLLAELDKAIDRGGDAVVERAKPLAIMVGAKWVGAAVLGGVAVFAAIGLAVTSARRLLQQLNRLRVAAEDLVDNRLPGVMERLSSGETVDVAVEAPPLDFGTDEVGQVGHAFNSVQQAAISAAAAQARQRENARLILLALGMRSSGLIERQIRIIDILEKRRDITDAELADLFELDQVTTRGLRYVGNLITLAGGQVRRGRQHPRPLFDVVRIAIGQVEGYKRITLASAFGNQSVVGHAVEDLTAVLAELLENACHFSPSTTPVDVEYQTAARGTMILIHDRGLGLDEEQFKHVNELLLSRPEFLTTQLGDAPQIQLGHFVVTMRSRSRGIQVTLKRSPYGGVTAVVLIPNDLMVDTEDVQPAVPASAGTTPAESPRRGGAADVAVLEKAPRALVAVTQNEEPAGASTSPAATEAPEESPLTPGGLPVRVPQANLADPLRTDEPVLSPEPEEVGLRGPEEIRRTFTGYQRGTKRARAQAGETDTAPEPRPDHGEPVQPDEPSDSDV